MTDLALTFRDDLQVWDIPPALGGDLQPGDALRSAFIVIIGSDRRAEESDRLPFQTTDRRGWWADEIFAPELPEALRLFGSRLWLLVQETATNRTVARARAYAEEAFAHWLEIGVARRSDVEAARLAINEIAIRIRVYRSGPAGSPLPAQRFTATWGQVYVEVV